jgi:hypothetical protein
MHHARGNLGLNDGIPLGLRAVRLSSSIQCPCAFDDTRANVGGGIRVEHHNPEEGRQN